MNFPNSVNGVFCRVLNKDPECRFANCNSFIEALHHSDHPQVPVSPDQEADHSKWPPLPESLVAAGMTIALALFGQLQVGNFDA